MTLAALLLILTSAALHATWNLWIKQIGGNARGLPMVWLLTAVSALLYAPVALGVAGRTAWRPSGQAWLWIAGSAVIHIVYFFLLLRGYRRGDLSVVYPTARGTGPLLAAAGAVLWFGERPTALTVAGAFLISAGVLVLTWRSVATGGGRAAGGVGYGLATGFMIAVYTLWDGWAVQRVGLPPLLFYWSGEVGRTLLLAPAAFAHRASIARLWGGADRARLLGIAALSPLSYILILLALRDGRVSHIAPAREISILFGAYLGGRVLGEGERTRRLAAAAAFVAGVAALAFA